MKRLLLIVTFLIGLPTLNATPLLNQQLVHFYTGESLSPDDLKGKVVYLDFWASWCKPCKKSFPFMNQLSEAYPEDQFAIVAINMDEDKQEAKDFLQKMPANFDIYTNPGNRLAETLDVPGLPVAYIIDKKGNIVAKHIGFSDRKAIKKQQQIAYLLEQ